MIAVDCTVDARIASVCILLILGNATFGPSRPGVAHTSVACRRGQRGCRCRCSSSGCRSSRSSRGCGGCGGCCGRCGDPLKYELSTVKPCK